VISRAASRARNATTTHINHLIEVVDQVASVEGGDMDVLIAALLHDLLEDTRTGYDELAAAFGKSVARIVRENSNDMTSPKPERARARFLIQPTRMNEAIGRIPTVSPVLRRRRAACIGNEHWRPLFNCRLG
jgi:hypothetical protein